MAWDIYITGLLLFVCTITPLHVAFNYTSYNWCIAYYLFDFNFLIDVIVIFFTTLPETDELEEIVDRKAIALAYIKGWFLVDVMAIFPFDLVATGVVKGSFEFCNKCSFEN